MPDLFNAISMLAYNSIIFLCLGRWSVQRTAKYRIGTKILDDITEILDKRQLIGDNEDGMTITHTRGWHAFGYEWKISVVQEKRDRAQGRP